jgi:hypothetical protein
MTHAEFAVLSAMCEGDSVGSCVWISVERLAAYSKLSERQVQRILHGLRSRGKVTELAPANSKHAPTTYQINEPAFEIDPKVATFLERDRQRHLPGIRRPAIVGEAIIRAEGVTRSHPYR